MKICNINQQQRQNFKGNDAIIRDGERWVSLTAGKSVGEIESKIQHGCVAKTLFLNADELVIGGTTKTKASCVPIIITDATDDQLSELRVVQRFGDVTRHLVDKLGLSGILVKGKASFDTVEAAPKRFLLYPTADRHQPKSNPSGAHADYGSGGSYYKNSL